MRPPRSSLEHPTRTTHGPLQGGHLNRGDHRRQRRGVPRGVRLFCELADDVGLTEALSEAMAPTKQRRCGHDRGHVLVDMAVAIADGATTLSDVRVLGDQPGLFGAWEARMDPGFYVIDIDATLVNAHSDKKGAAPHYKHGFGFQPMVAFLDATGEALAAILRPGNAAAGSAENHVRLLDAALAQLPVDPKAAEVIARTDSVGAGHGFVDACRDRGVRFIVGHRLSAELARLVLDIPQNRWMSTISADGTDERDAGRWPRSRTSWIWVSGPRAPACSRRREEPHPGAQLTFSDIDGHRY